MKQLTVKATSSSFCSTSRRRTGTSLSIRHHPAAAARPRSAAPPARMHLRQHLKNSTKGHGDLHCRGSFLPASEKNTQAAP